MTYHTFERLLDRIAAAPQWQDRHVPRPAGAQPGFLSALERLMRLSLEAVPSGSKRELPPVYIYKGRVYELRVRPLKTLGPTIVGGRKFDRLVSGNFTILNRETKEITKFGVTYPLDGPFAALPVQLTYRPNWWLSVELQLDDEAQVPADPATDAAQLARIRGICGAAQH